MCEDLNKFTIKTNLGLIVIQSNFQSRKRDFLLPKVSEFKKKRTSLSQNKLKTPEFFYKKKSAISKTKTVFEKILFWVFVVQNHMFGGKPVLFRYRQKQQNRG
jgi:hypothetical protein